MSRSRNFKQQKGNVMNTLLTVLTALWYFIKYILIGAGFLLNPYAIIVQDWSLLFTNPMGWIFGGFGVAAFLGNSYALHQWYWFDVGIASLVYGTRYRTISGITGEMAVKNPHSKMWELKALIIDKLAMLVGDKPRHCYRAYLWEKQNVDGVS